MTTKASENLDERIERIKKRNEEIEKKYREAEEDRLMALKDNAMVETKPPKDEDWPKAHKYDKIDFTYDVKPEKLEEHSKSAKKLLEEPRSKRDYKKFADGEGPPPDPAYNFLADAERDGVTPAKTDGKFADKKQVRDAKHKDQQQQQRRGNNNGSFRGRGGKAHNPKYQKQNSQPEYEQWRNERERIDEARINRQKAGEGKWRREWDNDKLNSENEALLTPERTTLGDALMVNQKRSPTHGNKGPNAGGVQNISPSDCLIEKRGNITVSVTQTGEVKSVKLTSAPVIGTGRVGPRQVGKPQFSVHTVDKEIPMQPIITPGVQQQSQNKNHHHKNNVHVNNNNNNIGHNNANRQQQQPPQQQQPTQQFQQQPLVNIVSSAPNPIKNKRKPQSPKYIPPQPAIGPVSPTQPAQVIAELPTTPQASANEIIPIVDLSHKPEFAKKSVQDRLIRARSLNSTEIVNANVISTPLSAASTEKTEASFAEAKQICDKTNESIQTATPIAACN